PCDCPLPPPLVEPGCPLTLDTHVPCKSHSLFFFLSSRRRHTSSKRDWSSDVCSSDLKCSRCLIFEISKLKPCVSADNFGLLSAGGCPVSNSKRPDCPGVFFEGKPIRLPI